MNNYTVKFYKNKITTFEYSEETKDWKELEIMKEHPEEIAKFFDSEVILEEGLTVGEFFNLIAPAEKELNYVYFSYMNGWPLAPFLEEMKKEPTSEAVYEDVELYWVCNSIEGKLDFYGSVQGWIFEDKQEKDYDGPYGLDFVKMHDLKNAKLIINPEFILIDTDETGSVTERGVLFSGELSWTLHHILETLFREITYYGSPENRETIIKDVDEKMKLYADGEVEFEKEDTARLELLKERMKEALEDEDYKMASKLKKKIYDLMQKIDNKKQPDE